MMSPPARTGAVTWIPVLLLTAWMSRAETPAATPAAGRIETGRKWVYIMTNFARNEATDSLIALVQRARRVSISSQP